MVTDVELAKMLAEMNERDEKEADERLRQFRIAAYVISPLVRTLRCFVPGLTTYSNYFSRSVRIDLASEMHRMPFLEIVVDANECNDGQEPNLLSDFHEQYQALRNTLVATFSRNPNPELAEGLPRAYGVAYQLMRRGGAALQVAAPVSLAFNPELAIPLYIGGTAMKTGAIALDTVVAQMCDNDDSVFVGPLQRIKHRLGIGAKQDAETIGAPKLRTAITQ